MNLLLILAISGVAFYAAMRWYGRGIGRILGIDDKTPTPAVEKEDGRDFVPTKPHILFGHHFSAIAGAGPIVGPTVAILYGFVPAWLWVVLGGIASTSVIIITLLAPLLGWLIYKKGIGTIAAYAIRSSPFHCR